MVKMLRYIKMLVKGLISLGILIAVFSIIDFHFLGEGINKLSLKVIAIAAIFCFLCSFFQALRWCYISRAHLNSSFLNQLLLFWRASFFNLVTPAALGADVYRMVANQSNSKSVTALGLILKERLVGLIGMFVCYLLFLAVALSNDHGLAGFFVTGGLFSLIALISLLCLQKIVFAILKWKADSFSSKWKKKLFIFSKAFQYQSFFELVGFTAITILSLCCWIIVYFVLAQVITFPQISIEKLGLVGLMTELVRWIPVTMQGIGIRESAAAYGFQLVGQPFELGFLVGGLAYCINTIVLFVIGFFSFLFSYWLNRIENKSNLLEEVSHARTIN